MAVGAACLLTSRKVTHVILSFALYRQAQYCVQDKKSFLVVLGSLQIVEVSARYDDACYPNTATDAERESLLMQVCLCLFSVTSQQLIRRFNPLVATQAYTDPLTEEQALACRAPPIMVVPRLMKAPIYIYYQLDNYHQNHRRCCQVILCML